MTPRLLAALLLVMLACRDEQAGPRRKPGAPAGAAPGAATAPATLDAEPRLTFRSGATWAQGAVEYLGSSVEPDRPKAGDLVTLRHYFRATRPVERGYAFFLHVMDVASGRQVGNLDHELGQGAAPLGTWPSGKIVEDVHGFRMPAYDGALQLMLGFWNQQGRLAVDTLPLSDGQGRVLGPRLEPAQDPLPEYRMPRAATPPTIDGALEDPAWAAAPAVVLTSSYDGQPVSRRTTVRLTYDDAFLYVAFDAEDPDIWGTLRNKDDAIYNEDACEVFLDADGDGATYNELQVSPHNVNFDAAFVARRSDLPEAMKWESGMVSAVKVKGTLDDGSDTDERWTAELKIPIAGLMKVPRVPPARGDVWRFNAYRLEHLERRTRIEGQSFSPLFVGDFHHLPRFGRLVFD